tara:strand:- start:644 stop:997 length:354 start_codon:yes stop_codon:yes gene_type:complete
MNRTEPVIFRAPERKDKAAIARIDGEGLAPGHAPFRDKLHDWASFQASFGGNRGVSVVVDTGEKVSAWAGISPTSSRLVYRGVGEVLIYVSNEAQCRGVGQALLETRVARSEEQGGD